MWWARLPVSECVAGVEQDLPAILGRFLYAEKRVRAGIFLGDYSSLKASQVKFFEKKARFACGWRRYEVMKIMARSRKYRVNRLELQLAALLGESMIYPQPTSNED